MVQTAGHAVRVSRDPADIAEALDRVRRSRRGRRSKYGAVPVEVDGVRFHSKREARRYRELRVLQAAGVIRDLELQPKYALHAVSVETGEVIKVGDFLADFRYRRTDTGAVTVEDTKGMGTLPLARWKQRHCRCEYGVIVQEVR